MTNDTEILRRYLLGDLPAAERERLEARYFADPGLLDQLQEAEQALLEDALDGRLAPAEREPMQRHYLANPAHAARLAVSRELRLRAVRAASAPARATVRAARAPRTARARRALAAVAAAALLAVTGLAVVRLRGEIFAPPVPAPASVPPSASASASAQAPAGASTTAPAPPVTPVPDARSVVALAVPALALRADGALPTVRRPAQPADVELALELEAAAPAGPFAVTVRSLEDVVAWQGRAGVTRDPAGGARVHVRVPFEVLPPDDYVVVLESTEPGSAARPLKFAFRVAAAEAPR